MCAYSSGLKRLSIWLLGALILLHPGLVVAYYLGHAFWGNTLWIVDAVGYMLVFLFVPSLVLIPLAILSRSKVMIAAAAIPLLLFVLTYGHLFLPSLSSVEASTSFKVMTFNVLDNNDQYEDVASQIHTHNPDILSLQELEPHMADSLDTVLGDKFPYQEVEESIGFFSRYPVTQYDAFQLSEDGHWGQRITLDIEGNQVTFLNVHPRSPRMIYSSIGLPAGFAKDDRDRDHGHLLTLIDQQVGPLVVMGDLNLTDRQDQYGQLREYLKDAHRDIGCGLGFTRTNYPEIGVPTWRIDYVLHTGELAALSAEVGDFAGSDHRPVVVELGFTGESS